MLALSRQKLETPVQMVNTILLYDHSARLAGIHLAGHFRKSGMAVQLIRRRSTETVEAYLSYAKRHHIRNLLYLADSGDEVLAYNVQTGQADTLSYTDYIQ